MAISRILFALCRRGFEQRSFILRRRIARRSSSFGLRLLPGGLIFFWKTRAGDPRLLFCLAPHGVFRAPELSLGAVGSYPAFSPLPRLTFKLPRLSAKSCGKSKRFVFCDTFRRKELSFSAPPLSQGVPPCGVRTFLSGIAAEPERPFAIRTDHSLKVCAFKAVGFDVTRHVLLTAHGRAIGRLWNRQRARITQAKVSLPGASRD